MTRRRKVLVTMLSVMAVGLGSLAFALSHDSECAPPSALPAGGEPMQAIVYRCYGAPEVLKLEQIAKPVPTDDQMLVKVRAAALNPLDWHYMRGEPYSTT